MESMLKLIYDTPCFTGITDINQLYTVNEDSFYLKRNVMGNGYDVYFTRKITFSIGDIIMYIRGDGVSMEREIRATKIKDIVVQNNGRIGYAVDNTILYEEEMFTNLSAISKALES